MAKTLDFNTLKKQYLTVKLPDENKTTLMVYTPTKAILDSFLNMRESLAGNSLGDEAIEELYDVVGKVMSCNKGGIKVTKKEVEELFDFEDIIIFIKAYTEFISEVSNSKN